MSQFTATPESAARNIDFAIQAITKSPFRKEQAAAYVAALTGLKQILEDGDVSQAVAPNVSGLANLIRELYFNKQARDAVKAVRQARRQNRQTQQQQEQSSSSDESEKLLAALRSLAQG